jgi:biopolymer transport protein TolR
VIVFIVTGQVVVSGTDVQLPDAKADQIALKEEPIEVSLNSEGAIFLGKTPVTPEAFEDQMAALAAAPKAREEQRVLVRADRSLPYGNVMKVVSVVSEAGFSRVAFVSDPPSLSNMVEAP